MVTSIIIGSTRTGFLDLPAEIRVDIYRKAFKSTKTIRCGMFHFPTYTSTTSKEILGQLKSSGYPYLEPPHLAPLSSQFLRSCKTVYVEAKPILFEVNTFGLERATELKLLKKLAGTCSPRIRSLSYENSVLVINKTRLRELKSLPSLEVVTISSPRSYLNLSPMDTMDEIARACQSDMNQYHPFLSELMRIRADVHFDIVFRGLPTTIVSSHWRDNEEK